MSGKTAITASIRKARRMVSKNSQFGYLLKGLEVRPKSERIASLIQAGILTEDGQLASKYR